MNYLRQYWEKWSNNGRLAKHSFQDIKRLRIINQFSIVGIVVALSYSIPLFFTSEPILALYDLDIAILGLIVMVLVKKIDYNTAAIFMFISIPISLLLINSVYGKVGAEYFYFSLYILLFYIFKNRVTLNLIAIYMTILFGIAKYFESHVQPEGIAKMMAPTAYYLNFALAFFIAWHFLRLFVSEHENYQKQVEEKNQQLEDAYHESQKKNEEIKMLMKELSHQTKNNLQLISSLINLQINNLENPEARMTLEESKNRIISIALLHKKIYQNERLTTVYFKEYLIDLINYLLDSLHDKNKKVDLNIGVDDFEVKIEKVVSLGLIFNEIITNSIKHGLIKESNYLTIKVKKMDQSGITCYVEDSGSGIEAASFAKSDKSFGMSLISLLVKQLDGKVEFGGDGKNSVSFQVDLEKTK
jgi:two-component sensor histidine kinase